MPDIPQNLYEIRDAANMLGMNYNHLMDLITRGRIDGYTNGVDTYLTHYQIVDFVTTGFYKQVMDEQVKRIVNKYIDEKG